jgi:hypothetical protein
VHVADDDGARTSHDYPSFARFGMTTMP